MRSKNQLNTIIQAYEKDSNKLPCRYINCNECLLNTKCNKLSSGATSLYYMYSLLYKEAYNMLFDQQIEELLEIK